MDLPWSFVSSIMASSSASASHYHSLPLQAKNPHMETISIIPLWSVYSIFSTVEFLWIFHDISWISAIHRVNSSHLVLRWSGECGQRGPCGHSPALAGASATGRKRAEWRGTWGYREGRKSPQWYDADAHVKNSVWHIWFGLLREPCYMCSWEFLKACVKKGYVYHL